MDFKKIKAAYQHASSLTGEARKAYLDELRRDDPDVAIELAQLLSNTAATDALFREPIGAAAAQIHNDATDPWAGRQLGAYRIVERIAAGGMGAVFLAERADEQFEQRVAIKIMTAQLLSDDAIERFKVERQLLASLQHPFIAQLIDGGTTDEGLPYLVMEYVDGEPIDAHCDANALSVQQRLGLFAKAAQAVDFAHRNLVVHRDIKPSNILVTADGTPKLLDFGIAKLLEPASLRAAGQQTQAGAQILTLEYASPEQVRAERVTTATDIYSLGVLLYRLLTGRSPYDISGDDRASVESQILQTPAEKPSSKITKTVDTAEDLGRTHSTTLSRLRRRLAGDLDNIVLMALRKEPERRYISANAMVADIDRYLNHLPVVARSDAWTYRAGKFIRRNALPVSFAAAAFLFLGVFAVTTAQQNERIAAERDVATSVSDFLVDIFDSARPETVQGEALTAEQVLDNGRERIDDLQAQPSVRARLMVVMADAYESLGLFGPAIDLFEQAVALGKQGYMSDGALAAATSNMALTYSHVGDFDAADAGFESAQQIYDRTGRPDVFSYAGHLTRYGNHLNLNGQRAESIEKLLQVIALKDQLVPDENGIYTNALHTLGATYLGQRNLLEAERALVQALETGHPDWGEGRKERAITAGLLGRVILLSNRPEEALPYVEQTLEILTRVYGPEHFLIAPTYSDLGRAMSLLNRHEEAMDAARKSLQINLKNFGDEHYNVATSYGNLATIQARQGNTAAALAFTERSLDVKKAVLPEGHPRMVISYQRIGALSVQTGDYEKGLAALNTAIGIQSEAVGEDNTRAAKGYVLRTRVHARMGALGEAQADAARGAQLHKQFSVPRVQVNEILVLAGAFANIGQCDLANEYARQATQIQQAESIPEDDAFREQIRNVDECQML